MFRFTSKQKGSSELRRDIISGDWVVIATGRAKRPHEFAKTSSPTPVQPRKACPFEVLPKNVISLYALPDAERDEGWWVAAIPNKYPAFGHGICSVINRDGLYEVTDGAGFHEVVITRDHTRSIGQMKTDEVELILKVYQDRYLELAEDACVEYISIFHNHGSSAGASISHPHSQIIAIPVIPPDITRSLRGAREYASAHSSCVHCRIIHVELEQDIRVIYQNDAYVLLAPYASRTAFEMRIYPKTHRAHFEEIGDADRLFLADILHVAMAKLHKGLTNPDYNFFIHTAPTNDSTQFHYYHWHIEIIPKTVIWAGFEIGTGIEISTIAPESAAAFLRRVKA